MKIAVVHLGTEHLYASQQFEKFVSITEKYNHEYFLFESPAYMPLQLRDGFFKEDSYDAILVFIGSFFEGTICSEIYRRYKDIPIFIQGIPEPEHMESDNVELNSWTGFNMYTSFLKRYKQNFFWSYGNVQVDQALKEAEHFIQAVMVKENLKANKLGIFGARVPGFYLSEVNQLAFQRETGIQIEYYDLLRLMDEAEKIPEEAARKHMEDLKAKGRKICVPEEKIRISLKIYLAVKKIVEEEALGAVSLRCWPEFEDIYGITVCSVLSMLNDDGIMASCESDISGLATMVLQHELTGEIPFFADLVDFNYETIKAWHCGQGPSKLAVGEVSYCPHPGYPQGYPTSVQMDMKLGEITLCKLSQLDGKIRLFCEHGYSKSPNKWLKGTQTDLTCDSPIEEIIRTIVENGFEHHYSIIHRDIVDELKAVCKLMNWDFIVPKKIGL